MPLGAALREWRSSCTSRTAWLFSRACLPPPHPGVDAALIGALFPLIGAFPPPLARVELGDSSITFVVIAVFLYSDRDVAPDLLAPLAACRGTAPVRSLLAAVLAALVLPAVASAHATLIAIRLNAYRGEGHGRRPRPEARALRARLRAGSSPVLFPGKRREVPKIGATSRSEYRETAITTNVIANPELHTGERRRKAPMSGKRAPISAVHPRMWWRKAAREKSQPFCSCTRIATPWTAKRQRHR